MGYAIIPDLTTGKYMCLTPCDHTDCAANRKDFIDHADCKICGQPLKAGDKFCYVEQGKNDKVHFACELERQERRQQVV